MAALHDENRLAEATDKGGMVTFSAGEGNFADLLHGLDARFYPAQENGGIGGIFSTDGKNNIDRWLKQFPGQYASIAMAQTTAGAIRPAPTAIMRIWYT